MAKMSKLLVREIGLKSKELLYKICCTIAVHSGYAFSEYSYFTDIVGSSYLVGASKFFYST